MIMSARIGGSGEQVRKIRDDWIFAQCGNIGRHMWNRHHVRRILHALPDGSVVGMVVAGSMSQYELRLELANLADDPLAHRQPASFVLAFHGRRAAVLRRELSPALDLIDDRVVGYVIELSSFQLERLAPHDFCAASILNLSEDHLDRHGNMGAYTAIKQRIYRNCELAVAYRGDLGTTPVAAVDRMVTFDIDEPTQGQWGVRTSSGTRYLACGEELVVECSALPLAGRHNELNVLAAFALLMNSGISNRELAAGVKSFSGLPHRCERIIEVAGVVYINDSKATNVGATLAALEGFANQRARRLVLIAGGDGKGMDFTPLREPVRRYVKAVVLLGRDAEKIADALDDSTVLHHVADMLQAVERAAEIASVGDLVLLSPACASLDMYENFAVRGAEFSQHAKGLAA